MGTCQRNRMYGKDHLHYHTNCISNHFNCMTEKEITYLTAPGNCSIERILEVVGKEYDILPEYIQLKTRKEEFVIPRQVCHFFAGKAKIYSHAHIGEKIGNLSKGAVENSIRTITKLIEVDIHFAKRIKKINSILNILD